MATGVFESILLAPVVQWIGGTVFGANTLGARAADGVAVLAKEKLGDLRKARDATRKIEDLAFSVVESLAEFAEHERLDPEALRQIAEDLVVAVNRVSLGDEIAKAGRDPAKLAAVLAGALPAGTDPHDTAAGLIVTAFAQAVCRMAGDLPAYEESKDRELFAQLDELLRRQSETARDLGAVRADVGALRSQWQNEAAARQNAVDRNERQYRGALLADASRVKLLGLEGDRHATGRTLPIETAYVPLRLRPRRAAAGQQEQAGPEDIADATWPELLTLLPDLGNRLLVEGIGGSGKTTLLQWAAVRALDRETAGPPPVASPERVALLRRWLGLADGSRPDRFRRSPLHAAAKPDAIAWFDRVPLFVRLRQLADGTLPAPEALPTLIAQQASGASEAWVRRLIDEQRAMFLLDGIDEVRQNCRDALASGIDAYLRNFVGCPIIATSRPAAVQDAQWANLFGTCRVLVERMARREIEAFVRHWYRAYAVACGEPCDERAVSRLIGQLSAREGLVGLMDTPLLSASICFLNKDRTDQLPTRAPELYRQLCRQLVHQLDEDRLKKDGYAALVPALRDLDADNKLSLLAGLAHLMVNNQAAVLQKDQAASSLRRSLRAIGCEQGRNVGEVLHALQERSGLLRGSSSDTVEFAHNNLRSWLAAAAFAENGEYLLPVERAFEMKDFDLPMLAAAQAGNTEYRARLIDASLAFARSHRDQSRAARIMALRCGQGLPVIEAHRAKLKTLATNILPPRDPDEAAWLAELGEAIVPRLKAQAERDAEVDAACVRCLRLIGGAGATAVLSSYLEHENEDVLDELAQGVPPLSIPRLRAYVTGTWETADLLLDGYKPVRHLATADLEDPDKNLRETVTLRLRGAAIPSVGWVRFFPGLASLDLDKTQVADLAPVAGLLALHRLNLSDTHVADLAPLAGLAALRHLILVGTHVADLTPLAGLTALQSLYLDETHVTDLNPLGGLTALQHLSLSRTPVADLAPLAGLTALQSLGLVRVQVADLTPLAGLSTLQHLDLWYSPVADLTPLAGLTALRSLGLMGTQVADLTPLAGLTALQTLDLEATQVADLTPLAGLTALRHVDLQNTQVADLGSLKAVVHSLRSRGVSVRVGT